MPKVVHANIMPAITIALPLCNKVVVKPTNAAIKDWQEAKTAFALPASSRKWLINKACVLATIKPCVPIEVIINIIINQSGGSCQINTLINKDKFAKN